MRYLLLTLTVGCAAIAPSEGPSEGKESEVVAAVLSACPIGEWCVEAPGVAGGPLLHRVFALDADNVYAVGDNGTILYRSNNDWTLQDSGTTNNLRGVWAASASDVWAVGVDGTIVRYNGTEWALLAGGGTADIDAVWGSSANDVWLVGSMRVLHWDGARFTSTNFGGTLLAVHGTGPNDVWVTGETTKLHRFNGTTWVDVLPTSLTTSYFAVLALTTTDVWTTSAIPTKETLRMLSVPTKWSGKATDRATFQSLSALSASDIWGTGGAAKVGHWNGLAWTTEQPFGANQILWSLTTAPGNLWIVGNDGFIVHRTF